MLVPSHYANVLSANFFCRNPRRTMTRRGPNPQRSVASVLLLKTMPKRKPPLLRRPRLRPRGRPLLLKRTKITKKRPHRRKLSVAVSPRLPRTMLVRSPRPRMSRPRRRAVLVELLAALRRGLLRRRFEDLINSICGTCILWLRCFPVFFALHGEWDGLSVWQILYGILIAQLILYFTIYLIA